MSSDLFFEKARKNPELRQAYLNTVLKQCPESVSQIIYDPQPMKKAKKYLKQIVKQGYLSPKDARRGKVQLSIALMAVVGSESMRGIKKTHPIFVTGEAFYKARDEKQFLNALIDHEAYHTQDMANGMQLTDDLIINHRNYKLLQPGICNHLRELRALRNEYDQAIKKGIREFRHLGRLEEKIFKHRRFLKEINPQNEFEKKVLERAVYNYRY